METFNKYKILLTLTFFAFSSFTYSQSSKNKVSSHNKQNLPSNFIKFFPDTSLALLVAERLNKKVTDNVTIKELASIKGYFEVGPGEVSNLKGIGYLIGIDSFNCYKNNVSIAPAEIGKLTNLVSLDFCKDYPLENLPKEIGNLKKLKRIRMSLTQVAKIPKEIGNLGNLEILWICCNNLTSIPKEIGKLTKLLELDIHSNNILELPIEICNLTSLVRLDISHCGLKRLPERIGNLKKLQTLNLFNNDLKYLPRSIKQLDNLFDLNVYDNFELSESYKKYLPKLLKKK